MSRVLLKDAGGGSDEFPDPVNYQGQDVLKWTPSTVEAQYGLLSKVRQRMSLVLEVAFHRTSACAWERGCCLVSFDSDTHHFPVIGGHRGLVTNPMIATIIQGCILLTAWQDPYQQEKTYFCHLSFKMTEMAEGFKQLPRAPWCTASVSEGMLQSLSLALWQDFSLFLWWVSYHQSQPNWWGITGIL